MSLVVHDLFFRYSRKSPFVIDGVSFSLKEGSLTALVGPSGCGKSTLLRLIVGFNSPYSGKIHLCGKKLNGSPFIKTEKRNIGMVFQNYTLFPHMTVAKNILFGICNARFPRCERLSRLNKILSLIEMVEFADYFPYMLSGGQQQRVSLGRSLSTEPKLLLLDEPFSNLDTFLRNKIRKDIKKLLNQWNITTLFVTHDESDLDIADSILSFKDGHLIPSKIGDFF